MKAHRHSLGHEHDHEPVRGLPEAPPPGEHVLWQGSPDWRQLAVRAFHLRKLVAYFAVLMVLRALFVASEGASTADAVVAALWLALPSSVALGLVALLAWLSARTTLYTITNHRVVMRIGIVLTLAYNLPFKRIAAAGLSLRPDGSGDIPLTLVGRDRIALLHLWPHARPWRVAQPEPMLRCLPRAAEAARVLSQAWMLETGGQTATTAAEPAAAAETAHHGHRQPVLAGGD
jgi:hypothetical protein